MSTHTYRHPMLNLFIHGSLENHCTRTVLREKVVKIVTKNNLPKKLVNENRRLGYYRYYNPKILQVDKVS